MAWAESSSGSARRTSTCSSTTSRPNASKNRFGLRALTTSPGRIALRVHVHGQHLGHGEEETSHVANAIHVDPHRQRVVVEQVADLLQRADRRDPPAGHDRDVVRQLLQRFEFVAGDEQALPLRRERLEEFEQLLPADRVDARRAVRRG